LKIIAWGYQIGIQEIVMKRLYEIFEQFPDHSSLWRQSAFGEKRMQRTLREIARKSANPIYAIDLKSGEVVRIGGSVVPNTSAIGSIGAFKKTAQASQVH
jgi:hypothetical protein